MALTQSGKTPDDGSPSLTLIQQLNSIATVSMEKRDYAAALQIAQRMVELDGNDMAGHLLMAQAYTGLGQHDMALSICDKEYPSTEGHTFSIIRAKAVKQQLLQKSSFVGLLPVELLEKIFLQINTFLEFSSCTQVCVTWRTFLMDNIWQHQSVSFFSAHPLSALSDQVQTELVQALRGEKNDFPLVSVDSGPFIGKCSIAPTKYTANQGPVIMHSVDLRSNSGFILRILEMNLYFLNDVTISSCSSTYSLSTLCDIISRSKITKLILTAPFILHTSSFVYKGTPPLKFKTMRFLKHVTISSLTSGEHSRLELVKSFLNNSPRLEELVVCPSGIPRSLDNMPADMYRPPTLHVLIY